MKYQFTVKKSGTSLEAFFAHGTLLEVGHFPFAVGIGPGGDYYELPGTEGDVPGRAAEFREEKTALVLVSLRDALAVRLNGTDYSLQSGEALPLKNGDTLELLEASLRVYRVLGRRPGTSFLCNALVYCVVALALLFSLIELSALVGLPVWLNYSSSWNSYRDRQMISREIDAMRKEMSQDGGFTVLQHAMLTALNEELTAQAAYFRANYAGMSRKQRKKMLENLVRMRDCVRQIREKHQVEQTLKPNTDAAVRKILDRQ